MFRVITTLIATWAAASGAIAQVDEGDVALNIESNQITTAVIVEGTGLQLPSRLFVAELGSFENEPANGDPTEGGPDVFQNTLPSLSSFVTNTPGFDSGAGVFDPAADIDFNIISWSVYDPGTDAYVDTAIGAETEELGISFNFDAVLTGPIAGSSVPVGSQFPSLATFANGRYHRHFLFTLLPVDDPGSPSPNPLADTGVYLLELTVSTNQAGVATSETFGVLFPFGVGPFDQEFGDAIDAALLLFGEGCAFADITSLGVCDPGVPDGDIELTDFSCYLSEWALGSSFADITNAGSCAPGTGGDGVDLSDFACYIAEWSGGCDGDPGTPN